MNIKQKLKYTKINPKTKKLIIKTSSLTVASIEEKCANMLKCATVRLQNQKVAQ